MRHRSWPDQAKPESILFPLAFAVCFCHLSRCHRLVGALSGHLGSEYYTKNKSLVHEELPMSLSATLQPISGVKELQCTAHLVSHLTCSTSRLRSLRGHIAFGTQCFRQTCARRRIARPRCLAVKALRNVDWYGLAPCPGVVCDGWAFMRANEPFKCWLRLMDVHSRHQAGGLALRLRRRPG